VQVLCMIEIVVNLLPVVKDEETAKPVLADGV
jgi:hypothetical protein